MASDFRFAICNEVFGQMPLDEVCEQVAALGYSGIELAPFTLGPDADKLDTELRRRIQATIRKHGLAFVGLHWLLVGPEGLHASTRDESVRKRTWNYVHDLIDLCADLADEGAREPVMVFGSPKQRSSEPDESTKEATDLFVHELAHVAPHAESRGVTVLLEALPLNQCDVVTNLSDAVCIVKQIGSPAVQTMFDVHNAVDETSPHTDLVRKYASYIRHVHVNELDGSEPGMGDYDFASLLGTLSDLHYAGWVSVEAFDFSRNPTEIARRAIDRLRACAQMPLTAKHLV
jgi:D-psicose/D-tagatose/L-ribulose 3-epimerase